MTAYLFPGQGSQKLGMGEALFHEFPEIVAQADDILGYSIVDLCLRDSNSALNNTAFTQPALYTVNALHYLKKLKEVGIKPDYFLGHSLGEYNALWAAGVFDFETGLKLVQKRGQLMSQVIGGGMAAVIGMSSEDVLSVLAKHELQDLSIANYNAYLQQVISGSADQILKAKPFFVAAGAKLYHPLPVNGAFHSPLVQKARVQFEAFIADFNFSRPEIPVIANINALPYPEGALHTTLSLQIEKPVQWLQSVRYLLLHNESVFEEIGPGNVLSNLVSRIINGQ